MKDNKKWWIFSKIVRKRKEIEKEEEKWKKKIRSKSVNKKKECWENKKERK